MDRQTRTYGRFVTSAQALIVYAALVLSVAAIDVVTRRSLNPITRIELTAWLLGAFVITTRIVRVLRKIEASGAEWTDAEKLLFQLAMLMPIAGIIPLAFL